uniref:cDNA FLJ44595 fis, clone BLADE2004849 n=1 Tax=Homo sapiens TaxID=9606 RepID=Q6ZTJ3_HUMAN|nr:unnamed protein product [Homo sapiens]
MRERRRERWKAKGGKLRGGGSRNRDWDRLPSAKRTQNGGGSGGGGGGSSRVAAVAAAAPPEGGSEGRLAPPSTSHSSLLAFFPTVPRSARLRPRSAHARPHAYECLRARRWLLPPTTTFGRPARQPARTRSPTGTPSSSPSLPLRPCQAGAGAGPHAYLQRRKPKPPPPPPPPPLLSSPPFPAPTATNRRHGRRRRRQPPLPPSTPRACASHNPPRGTVPFLSAAGAGEEGTGRAGRGLPFDWNCQNGGPSPTTTYLPGLLAAALRLASLCSSSSAGSRRADRGLPSAPLPTGGWRPRRLRVESFPAG